MIHNAALAFAFFVGLTGSALAQVNVAGTYDYSGTEVDGSKYEEDGTLVVSPEPSGAYLVKWDGGEYVGVGQVAGNVFAVAAVAEKKNTIILMEIGPDGNMNGRWWRRSDKGSKGTEIWKKKK
ncbi:MAG: hypothetical protein HQL34_06035 [Alphaproteobacteria bacterium]|nr:hypothetical protein [Alphaproteobacteria bacterium]